MKVGLRHARTALAAVAVAGTLFAGGGVALGPIAQADFGTIRATTAVNVRSSASTSAPILGVLYLGSTAKQTGPIKQGWVPIKFNGRSAWVAANYLTGVRATSDSQASMSGPTGALKATEALNVRTGPSLSARVVGLLSAGSAVKLTGTVSGQYSQIIWKDSRAWVSSAYLGAGANTTSVKGAGQARATADLMIRTAPGKNFRSLGDVPKGAILILTGKKSGGVSEILWQGSSRWVNSAYLAPVGSTPSTSKPSTPSSRGTQYATTALDIRTTSGSTARTVTEVPKGTALSVTGVVQNGRAQVVYNGAVRWVTAKYLSATKPSTGGGSSGGSGGGSTSGGRQPGPGSSGLSGLRPATKAVLNRSLQQFPKISTYYGVRPDSIPDHPGGYALDLMLPGWSSSRGRAYGWQVANYFRANAKSLGIQYIIFDQKIWNIARNGEGWRSMADRGGATANHKDHVHISTVGV